MKLVNYVRAQSAALKGGRATLAAETLTLLGADGGVVAALAKASPEWQADSLMTPVLENDGLIMDGGDDWDVEEETCGPQTAEDVAGKLALDEDMYYQLQAMKVSAGAEPSAADEDDEENDPILVRGTPHNTDCNPTRWP